MSYRLAAAAPFALLLVGCGQNASAPANETAAPATTGTVERQEVTPEPTAAPAQPQPSLGVQPGPEGSQVTLTKVAVTGDVMTVQLSYAGQRGYDYVKLDQVSVIDDATAQRIGVLKDNSGGWLAAPLSGGDKNELRIELAKNPVVWLKFPAPPATSKTVSINMPNVGPFDGVPVAR